MDRRTITEIIFPFQLIKHQDSVKKSFSGLSDYQSKKYKPMATYKFRKKHRSSVRRFFSKSKEPLI